MERPNLDSLTHVFRKQTPENLSRIADEVGFQTYRTSLDKNHLVKPKVAERIIYDGEVAFGGNGHYCAGCEGLNRLPHNVCTHTSVHQSKEADSPIVSTAQGVLGIAKTTSVDDKRQVVTIPYNHSDITYKAWQQYRAQRQAH
jgi:hypothetical protein